MRTSPFVFTVAAAVCAASFATTSHALPPQQQSYLNSLSPQAQAAVNAELSACPTCQLEPLPDGTPNVIAPSAEPNASTPDPTSPLWFGVFTPSAPTCNNDTANVSRQTQHETLIGNSIVGVYFRTNGSTSTTYSAPAARRFQSKGLQAVGGKLLGFAIDVARAEAEAIVQGNTRSIRSTVLLRSTSTGLLQTVDTKTSTAAGSVTLPPISAERTFAQHTQVFTVGPFPVRLHAALRGTAREDANGRTSTTNAYVLSNYNAALYVDGNASLEAYVAAVGADAQLTFLAGGTPTSGWINSNNGNFTWNHRSDITLNALSGWIKVWARVGYGWFSKTWRHTVAQWSGFNWSHNLFNQNGSLPHCWRMPDLGMAP